MRSFFLSSMICLGLIQRKKGVSMNDDIIRFLDLKDANIESVSSIIRKGKRIVTLQKKLMVTYCPICSHRMHSKGIYKRVLNHPIMQDGMQLSIVLNQRRWKCSNPACQHSMNDEFSFIEPYRRITNATVLHIQTGDLTTRSNLLFFIYVFKFS